MCARWGSVTTFSFAEDGETQSGAEVAARELKGRLKWEHVEMQL